MDNATISKYRSYFVNLDKVTSLAACSQSPLSKPVLAALDQYKNDLLEYGNPWDMWMEKVEESKKLFATLINANPDEICPSSCVSQALSSLLSGMHYTKRRNEIVVSDMEYPTTNFIFLAQRKYGATVKTIKNKDWDIPIEKYKKAVTKSTLLISAIHVSSMNGLKQNVGKITDIAHKVGSYAYVDAYQSMGNTELDVKKEDIDFLTTGTLKYLLGLPGWAFLYIRKDLIPDLEPTNIGWFSQTNPFLFGAEELDYAKTADRFQSGTWSIPSLYATIAGLKIILEVGISNIEERIRQLTRHAIDYASELGLETITPLDDSKRGAMVSFVVKNSHKLELKLNREEKIITSSRGIGLRIAPHFYNTEKEIEKAVSRIYALKDYEGEVIKASPRAS